MKPLRPPSLDTFCQIFATSQGKADITCPADDYHVSCLCALERRGLIKWDTERVNGTTKRWCALTRLGAKTACEQLAVMPSGITAQRQRVCVSMFLDLNNDDHYKAWTVIESLKKERIFTPTIVDLLLMHSEFLNGDDTTLREAYPGIHKMLTETKEQNLLDKLETLIQNAPQSTQNADNSAPKGLQPLSGLKPLTGQNNGIGLKGTGQQFAAPEFDDEDDIPTLKIEKAKSDGSATQNFLNSLKALQGK